MSGVGRGRGWLNMNKTTKPGLTTETNTIDAIQHDDVCPKPPQMQMQTQTQINSKYAPIIAKISLCNENDDGILFNKKLKEVIKEFNQCCENAEDVTEACTSVHDYCLNDEEFATKAIAVVAASSFKPIKVHGVQVRMKFVNQFQIDFDGCVQLQTNNPAAFRNTVQMLGDFYHKALLVDGKPFRFLCGPVSTYLEMLLDSNDELDFQLFTVQLYMNGNEIKDRSITNLNNILIKVRSILSSNDRISSNSKLWLLMALDIANNRFNILPTEIHQFYLERLGDVSMARIRKLTTELSIQTTYPNAKLDGIQSNVSVLQQVVSSSTGRDGWESPSSTITDSDNNRPKNRNNSFNNIGTWEQPKNEKQPRPILGAGARAKHDRKNNDSSWRDRKIPKEQQQQEQQQQQQQQQQQLDTKMNTSNKDNKKIKQKKGWEHDDRFENNY